MPDVFDPEKRSDIMRAVKSKGNRTTELRLIEIFKKNGFKGWRRGSKLIGRPDFVFPAQKIAVFVDGCFWHGHACRNTRPRTNEEYWRQKRKRNALRDKEITERFESRGWLVLRLWECELTRKNMGFTLRRIQDVWTTAKQGRLKE